MNFKNEFASVFVKITFMLATCNPPPPTKKKPTKKQPIKFDWLKSNVYLLEVS